MSKSTAKFVFFSVFPAILLFACFAPSLVPIAWHFHHGDIVILRGKQIVVPNGWYPDQVLYYDVSFIKPRLTLFSERFRAEASFSTFSVGKRGSAAEIYQRFEDAWRRIDAGVDGNTQPTRIPMEDSKGFCLEFSPRRYPGFTSVECSLFDAEWTAHFSGQSEEAENFFRMLRAIEPNPK